MQYTTIILMPRQPFSADKNTVPFKVFCINIYNNEDPIRSFCNFEKSRIRTYEVLNNRFTICRR